MIWTEADDAIIRQEYPTCNVEELAAKLGRTVAACWRRASYLDVVKIKRKRKRGTVEYHWSTADCDLVRKEYPTGNLAQLAATLGRSLQCVRVKANTLGVKRCKGCEISSPKAIGQRRVGKHHVAVHRAGYMTDCIPIPSCMTDYRKKYNESQKLIANEK